MLKTNDELTQEELKEVEEWISSKPSKLQEVIRRKPPGVVYVMNTGQRCMITAYDEPKEPYEVKDITLKVLIVKGYNLHYEVFGVRPEALRPYKGDDN